MLSRALMRVLQRGQGEGGETIDSPRGTRQMTTLRKLPTQAPKSAAYVDAIAVRCANLLLAWVELAPGVLDQARSTGRAEVTERCRREDHRRLVAAT